jgi:hypothetical protein
MKNLKDFINENSIKIGGAKITNQVDDYSKFNTINELCDSVETHYINNYKDSNKISQKLYELHLIEEDQKETSGVLYRGGRLLYFFYFKKMEYLCAFLVYLHKYLEVFDYDRNLDNKWHVYFDIHGDPLTGVEYKTTCWHLEYRSKDRSLKKLDKAIEDFYNELDKIEPYSGLQESIKDINYQELFKNIYSNYEGDK